MGQALSMTAAAALIGIDRHTLKKLTDEGTIPHWFKTPGGRYMYSRGTIEEHQRLAAQRRSGGAA
jgi:DNA-binding transcriptional MerR regulator